MPTPVPAWGRRHLSARPRACPLRFETRGETMVKAGDRLENPVTGETLIFHRTAGETVGEAVLVETIVRPNGFVAAAHVHPHQSERFAVLTGRLGLRIGHDEQVAEAGQ